MKTNLKQLNEFFIEDEVVNRHIYLNIKDYDSSDFGNVQWFDMYQEETGDDAWNWSDFTDQILAADSELSGDSEGSNRRRLQRA